MNRGRPRADRRSRSRHPRRPGVEALESRRLLAAITEFPAPLVPTSTHPSAITLGPDGNLWFTADGQIARITPTGKTTEFPLPVASQTAFSISPGPGGDLWFTAFTFNVGGSLGRISTSGQITEYPLAKGHEASGNLANGADGHLYFVDYTEPNPTNPFPSFAIGQVGQDGEVVDFPTLPATSNIAGITAGSDGNIWFTAEGAGGGNPSVDRITPTGQIAAFPIPSDGTNNPHFATSITTGPDGALWFVDSDAHTIGRVTTTGQFRVFPLPAVTPAPSESEINGIVAGPDHALYFIDNSGANVGRITTAGNATEFPLFPKFHGVNGLTNGPDGAIWLTEDAGKIGRLTPSGVLTEFPAPTVPEPIHPHQITPGPDGAEWFLASLPGDDFATEVSRIGPDGRSSSFPLPATVTRPGGITTGLDGNLWITALGSIARMTPAGVFTVFPLPTANFQANSIATGPDGALWFTENPAVLTNDSRIGRITTSGKVTEYQLFTPTSPFGSPREIVAGSDGNLWFDAENSIGRITPTGQITGFPLLATGDSSASAGAIASGPDGALYFAFNNGIGRITTSGLITAFPSTSVSYVSSIAAGSDGGIWFTTFENDSIGRITPQGNVTSFSIPTFGASAESIAPGPDGNLYFTEPSFGKIGRVNLDQMRLPHHFQVTNVNDNGPGSLRQAILDADADPTSGVDQIGFAISGVGFPTINLTSSLPAITRPVDLDASTGLDYSGSPLVAIDGSKVVAPGGGLIDGLTLGGGAGGSTIRGLEVIRFSGNGIVDDAGDVTIDRDVIGTGETGIANLGNGQFGLKITGPGATVTNDLIAFNGFRAISDLALVATSSGNTIHDNGSQASLLTLLAEQASPRRGRARPVDLLDLCRDESRPSSRHQCGFISRRHLRRSRPRGDPGGGDLRARSDHPGGIAQRPHPIYRRRGAGPPGLRQRDRDPPGRPRGQ